MSKAVTKLKFYFEFLNDCDIGYLDLNYVCVTNDGTLALQSADLG